MSWQEFSPFVFEFMAIATLHFFAVASPGPDFAVVVKQSVVAGRRAAMLTSIGIGVGILVHVVYSLLGIGLLIKTTPWLFQLFLYAAAGYLLFLGWGAIRSKPKVSGNEDQLEVPTKRMKNNVNEISDRKSFLIGLVTNGLNPKATLFFLTVFAVAVSPETPLQIKVFYGLYLATATGMWFCFLSYILSGSRVRATLTQNGHIFDRIMGAILIALAINLIFSV
ncbi:LysE family transporter [Aliiglaciecola sp. M165]|uniref:LysE family transporter n=1 Tax=Aliiglaciecola sp. M165 TaxID=2593649 RepID=UPI00117BE560|nr:LysE family transporter [Aliiglaciecola sp. M165]TRY30123.1 LysE family translocator [Aliiglaciecola sp. M165]